MANALLRFRDRVASVKQFFSLTSNDAGRLRSDEVLAPALARAFPVASTAATPVLLHYAYLQVLDLLTTSAFLLAGVREANPMVVFAMRLAANPIIGLAAVKILALMLGLFCWWTARARLLRAATAFYAVLVAYNLVCLIFGLAAN